MFRVIRVDHLGLLSKRLRVVLDDVQTSSWQLGRYVICECRICENPDTVGANSVAARGVWKILVLEGVSYELGSRRLDGRYRGVADHEVTGEGR